MELDGTATNSCGDQNVGDFTAMTKKLPPGFSDLHDLRKKLIMIDYVTYMYMKKKKGRNVHHLFDVYNGGCVNTPNQIRLHQFIIFPDL